MAFKHRQQLKLTGADSLLSRSLNSYRTSQVGTICPTSRQSRTLIKALASRIW